MWSIPVQLNPCLGFTLLRTSEEMIETLEENQVQLQSMMVSKFIGHFFNEISGWQKTLGVVDQVITDSITISLIDWYTIYGCKRGD